MRTKLIYERSINMKKLISLILVVFMTAIIPLSAVAETEPNAYDVNGDGKVNMFDYIFIKGIYFGSIDTEPEFDGADVNGDGNVNIFDCVLVKKAYLSSDSQPDEARYISYNGHCLDALLNDFIGPTPEHKYGATCPAYIITDFEQFDELLDTYLHDSIYADNGEVTAFYESLDEDYFETKALVITPIYLYSGSVIAAIEGIKTDGNEIVMEISSILYGVGTDDVQYRLMTAEVNKSDIIGCTSARAEIVESNIYGVDHYFNADSWIATDETLPHRLITNFEQLEELCDGNPELAEYAESLPEGFFDTKVLTLTQIEHADGSYVAYTAAVTYGKQGLTVYIEKYSRIDGSYPDLFTVMFAVTELDRADIGDVSTFNAEYVD